jgi:hypothetical protein
MWTKVEQKTNHPNFRGTFLLKIFGAPEPIQAAAPAVVGFLAYHFWSIFDIIF